ncbi:MAG: universal stress protein [Desulfobacterales bacterium]|nr:universal stress protein [Desulfobacterales bacterium]
MEKFKKILFPVDLSEISPKLVPYVSEMAIKFNSEIHILFVVRTLDYFAQYHVLNSEISDFQDQILGGAKKRMDEFKNKYFKEFSKKTGTVEIGDVSGTILNYIKDKGIDLLIMGTHGRKGLDKIVFGSVADRISKSAQIPVLLVNPYKI